MPRTDAFILYGALLLFGEKSDLMGFQPVGHLLGNALDAAILKGYLQAGSSV